MSSKRQYNGRFKAQVALDAIRSEKTIGEIASHYSIHPDEALAHYNEALEIYRKFFQRYPTAHSRNFMITLRGALEVYEKLGMKKEAEQCRREMARVNEVLQRAEG